MEIKEAREYLEFIGMRREKIIELLGEEAFAESADPGSGVESDGEPHAKTAKAIQNETE